MSKMWITMIKDAVGADDGIHAKKYLKGETYVLSEGLAKCFLDLKVGREAEFEEIKDPTLNQAKSITEREITNKALTSQNLENKVQDNQPTSKKDDEEKETE